MCPSCHKTLEITEWQKIMNKDYVDSGFEMNKYAMPCCNALLNLNELEYYFYQGFSKYAVIIEEVRAREVCF